MIPKSDLAYCLLYRRLQLMVQSIRRKAAIALFISLFRLMPCRTEGKKISIGNCKLVDHVQSNYRTILESIEQASP